MVDRARTPPPIHAGPCWMTADFSNNKSGTRIKGSGLANCLYARARAEMRDVSGRDRDGAFSSVPGTFAYCKAILFIYPSMAWWALALNTHTTRCPSPPSGAVLALWNRPDDPRLVPSLMPPASCWCKPPKPQTTTLQPPHSGLDPASSSTLGRPQERLSIAH